MTVITHGEVLSECLHVAHAATKRKRQPQDWIRSEQCLRHENPLWRGCRLARDIEGRAVIVGLAE